MIDPRTVAILNQDLDGDTPPDPRRLDRQLLYGLDADRLRARPPLKVAFHDFWPEFNRSRNFFTEILGSRFQVTVVADHADLGIYSVFGTAHQRAISAKILYYTGENTRPPIGQVDMAVSFDRLDHPDHFRLPLYVVHAYDHAREGATPCFSAPLLPRSVPSKEEWRARKFCAFLYKNPHCQRRNEVFHQLHRRCPVDAMGWHLNNTGQVVKAGWLAKIRVFSRYRFAFAFENASHPGYVTEKILDAFQAGTIPLYWGCRQIAQEVDPSAFINADDFADDQALVSHILEIDQDYDRWRAMATARPFLNRPQFHFDAYRLSEWIAERL